MTKFISLLSLTLLFSCATGKKATVQNQTNDTARFIVSFYSIGSGIDTKEVAPFRAFIKEFETKNKTTINFETTNWGREGETDFCFNIADLSEKLQVKFIKESKENLQTAEHIHYKENESCRKN